MPTLTNDTHAIQIHGITKQQISSTTLDKGTRYKILYTHHDAFDSPWIRIDIDGYLYDIADPRMQE